MSLKEAGFPGPLWAWPLGVDPWAAAHFHPGRSPAGYKSLPLQAFWNLNPCPTLCCLLSLRPKCTSCPEDSHRVLVQSSSPLVHRPPWGDWCRPLWRWRQSLETHALPPPPAPHSPPLAWVTHPHTAFPWEGHAPLWALSFSSHAPNSVSFV